MEPRILATKATIRRRLSFTMIEILVVMFIVAALIGLLLPALTTAKGKAQQASCMNSLHQIHIGLELYAEDHNSAFPITGNVGVWGDGIGWTEQIYKYTKSQAVYRCPGQPKDIYNDYSYFLNSYSAATNSGGNTFFTRDHIKVPSIFILAGDSTYPFNPLSDTDKDNKTQDCLFTWNVSKAGTKRYHGGNVCVLFADGHLVVSDRFKPELMTYSFHTPGVDFGITDPGP